ncbi:hypothetical protein [Streptomyces decoyicus]|uniref:hypothetical protein n=1 Tax=Streptomyces decoyicus TaxID=249567 RepID=UPI00069473F9|nr:hypothetical protein [Streptomyces decoyicus]QZY20014.1 hypothetical protein K7C20_36305 [Streptomyces decoyicus]
MKEPGSEPDRLRVRTGAEPSTEAEATDTSARTAELRAALDSIRSIRHLTNLGANPEARPAEWERRRLLRTVSLLLEAEGIPPSAAGESGDPVRTGYRTCEGDRLATVLVCWVGPRGSGTRYQDQEHLRRCQEVLRSWGFEALEVRGPGGRRYLEVEASRA